MGDNPTGETALTVAQAKEPQRSELITLNEWGFGGGKGRYLTSFDERTPAGKIAVFKLLNGNGELLDEYFNLEIAVTDYLMSPISKIDDKTGEVVRLLLIRIVGEVVETGIEVVLQTTAKTVAETLLLYSEKVRSAPWDPPAVFKPRKMSTRSGGQYYQLEPMFKEFVVNQPIKVK